MKKYIALLLASMLVIGSLAACNRNGPEPDTSSSGTGDAAGEIYQNGEYSVRYTAPAQDRTLDYLTISVATDVVTIKDYGMTEGAPAPAVSSEEASSDAAAASEAAPSSEASSEAQTEHELTAAEAAKDIRAEYEAVGQDVEKMEYVPGSTEHFYRFQRMMRTALELAKKGDTNTVELKEYADGVYEATMPVANVDGWIEFVKITVKDGAISTVDYNAAKEGDPASMITQDAELNKGENKPSEYYPQIAKSYVDAGFMLEGVLSPTGGASATKSFLKLMDPLMVSMLSGGDTKVTASPYVDGKYKAQFKDFDENGWKEFVELVITNGVVKVTKFDAFSKDDEAKLKSKDVDVSTKMVEKAGINYLQASEALRANWDKAENDVLKVDNVAGATVSSNNFKLLVGEILATTAQQGDNEAPLEIDRFEVK